MFLLGVQVQDSPQDVVDYPRIFSIRFFFNKKNVSGIVCRVGRSIYNSVGSNGPFSGFGDRINRTDEA